MIEKIRCQEIKDESTRFDRFEVFKDQKGKFQFMMVKNVKNEVEDRGVGKIVDFEDGVSKKEFFLSGWKGEIRNIDSLRCIVSERKGCLLTIHYDENFRIKDDYNKAEEICGDVYQRKIAMCVFKGSESVVFLRKEIEDEIVFFDLRRGKVLHTWKAPRRENDRRTYLTWLRYSEVSKILLVGTSSNTFILDMKKTNLLQRFDPHQKIEIRNVKVLSYYFGGRDVFIDYSGKNSFGVCGSTAIHSKAGLNLFRLDWSDDGNEKKHKIDVKSIDTTLGGYFCRYGYGDDFFFGDNVFAGGGGIIQSRSSQKKIKDYSKCGKTDFKIENRGRDIFVVWYIQDKELTFPNNKRTSISYFVNTQIPRVLNYYDEDEIERIEYLLNKNLEDEKIEIFRISIFQTNEFNVLKIILLL